MEGTVVSPFDTPKDELANKRIAALIEEHRHCGPGCPTGIVAREAYWVRFRSSVCEGMLYELARREKEGLDRDLMAALNKAVADARARVEPGEGD